MRIISVLSVLAILASVLAFTGCTGQPATLHVSLGQAFTLAPGQQADLASESLSIKFVERVADSRCPTGVQCIWAGEVSCLTEVTLQGETSSLVLTQPGGSPAAQEFNQYRLAFTVDPYPEYPKQIALRDYRLNLTITKP